MLFLFSCVANMVSSWRCRSFLCPRKPVFFLVRNLWERWQPLTCNFLYFLSCSVKEPGAIDVASMWCTRDLAPITGKLFSLLLFWVWPENQRSFLFIFEKNKKIIWFILQKKLRYPGTTALFIAFRRAWIWIRILNTDPDTVGYRRPRNSCQTRIRIQITDSKVSKQIFFYK